MVIRMRHTKSHTANRRSHHALKGKSFSKCSHCGALKMPHVACGKCGYYGARQVLNVVAKVEKKAAKNKAKEKEAAK